MKNDELFDPDLAAMLGYPFPEEPTKLPETLVKKVLNIPNTHAKNNQFHGSVPLGLIQSIDALPEPERQITDLVFGLKLSLEKIAEQSNLSLSDVIQLQGQAIRRLSTTL